MSGLTARRSRTGGRGRGLKGSEKGGLGSALYSNVLFAKGMETGDLGWPTKPRGACQPRACVSPG